MFFKLTSKHYFNLYSKNFFLFSCVANLISSIFAIITLSNQFIILPVIGICAFVGMIIERLYKFDYNIDTYNERYIIKIFYEIVITTIGFFTLSSEYLMYLPILLSMLYLNVNTIIKSKLIQYSTILFMLTPILKIFTSEIQNIPLYSSVCVLFILVTFLSNFLFKSHQELIEESKQKENILIEVYKLTQRPVMHNIKNELTRLYLIAHKYTNDPGAFIEELRNSSESIQRFANTYLFDNEEIIDLENLIIDLERFLPISTMSVFNSFIDRKEIVGNRNFIYSVIKKILDNCAEKCNKNKTNSDVILIKRENYLIVRDECGTNVSNEFEIFLNVIKDQSVKNMFKYNIEISEITNGYEYKLLFK